MSSHHALARWVSAGAVLASAGDYTRGACQFQPPFAAFLHRASLRSRVRQRPPHRVPDGSLPCRLACTSSGSTSPPISVLKERRQF